MEKASACVCVPRSFSDVLSTHRCKRISHKTRFLGERGGREGGGEGADYCYSTPRAMGYGRGGGEKDGTALTIISYFLTLTNMTPLTKEEKKAQTGTDKKRFTRGLVLLRERDDFFCGTVQDDGIYAFGKAHMRSTASLRSSPNVAFETVPMLV